MKKIMFIVLLVSSALFAQRQSLIEGEIESGGFGAPKINVTTFKGETGVLVGGYGGWLINHQLLLGGGGFGLVNQVKSRNEVQSYFDFDQQPYLNLGYGGGIIEYYFQPDQIMHTSVSLLIGAGGVSYRSDRDDLHLSTHGIFMGEQKADAFFVLEPGISGELNVAKHLKIGLSMSYRWVNGIDIYGLSNSDLSGVSAGLAFKFGSF